MANWKSDVVQPEELEYFVQSLRSFSLSEIGNGKWIDCHEMLIRLSQQAILEASTYREEAVKEMLILHSKLEILVHEAFCVLVWKLKILPILLEMDPNPSATFLIYTVLYHEGAVITLLEAALYHPSGCEALGDSAIDLVDYCAQAITQVIGLVSMGYHENTTNVDVDESTMSELERQKRDLLYKVGIRCLTILNYLSQNIEAIPISVKNRLVTVHDIPLLLTEILHLKPWIRRLEKGIEKFIDDKWVLVDSEQLTKVTKTEAQVWFCLRELLLNPNIMKIYEINEFRQRELSKCSLLMNEVILDQLPPLIELKHYLCTLPVSYGSKCLKDQKLVLEEVPQIRENIVKGAEKAGGYLDIAVEQAKVFLATDKEEIFSLAKRINDVYNTDILLKMEDLNKSNADLHNSPNKEERNETVNKNICGQCQKAAEKKCSNCKTVYYCFRECQVEHWSEHKEICLKSTI